MSATSSTSPLAANRLGKRLFDALKDCADFTRTGAPYLWKKQAMRQLAQLGLVEQREGITVYFATKRGLVVAESGDEL